MGGLNGLINNAGILRDGLLVKKDRTTGEVKKLSKDRLGRRHRREPHRRDVHGARRRREDGAQRAAPRRDRQHVEHRAPRQPRSVELRRAKAALAANTVTWAREFAAFGIRVGASPPA
jgi:3-oxoacyl-[acyl-carrier protein] reductase